LIGLTTDVWMVIKGGSKMGRRLLFYFAVILIVAMMSGCGGGGSAGTSQLRVPSNTRSIVTGDTVTYTVTGTATSASSVSDVTGTATATTTSGGWSPTYGSHAFVITRELNLSVNGTPLHLTLVKSVEQGVDGTIYLVKEIDAEGTETLTGCHDEPVTQPGTFSTGQVWSYTATWHGDADFSEDISYNVTGTESVAGYGAYKICTVSSQNSVDDPSTCDELFAPNLGYPVKSCVDFEQGGTKYALDLVIQSSNIEE
jgi:hypothetical protein